MKRIVLSLVVLSFVAAFSTAQEESVNPGINKSFQNPDVEQFQDRFEREDREVFANRDKIIEATGVRPNMNVADIGAGTGFYSMMFAEKVGRCGHVYSVDIAENFINHIEMTARKQGIEHLTGVVCDPDDTKLPANSIDLVFICDTYHHFEYPYKTMQSIHRALKPCGRVVLIDFHRIEGVSSEWTMSHVRAGQGVFEKEIEQAGFRKVSERTDLLKENYFVVFEKK